MKEFLMQKLTKHNFTRDGKLIIYYVGDRNINIPIAGLNLIFDYNKAMLISKLNKSKYINCYALDLDIIESLVNSISIKIISKTNSYKTRFKYELSHGTLYYKDINNKTATSKDILRVYLRNRDNSSYLIIYMQKILDSCITNHIAFDTKGNCSAKSLMDKLYSSMNVSYL